MDKQKIIRTIRECASKLKRKPTIYELDKAGVPWRKVTTHFDSMREALKAAGLEPIGSGYRPDLAAILLDWAAVARKLGRHPKEREYVRAGKYSSGPFIRRFGRWSEVPGRFASFARQQCIVKQWRDVLKGVRIKPAAIMKGRNRERGADRATRCDKAHEVKISWNQQTGEARLRLAPTSGRVVYGAPLDMKGMVHEPTNEDGVICLFGMLAARLGLLVRRIQGEFPDCEVLYEIETGRWISLLIEFEFESRNFAKHGHRADGCDMIVCWTHNWSRCPANLQVLELSRVVREL